MTRQVTIRSHCDQNELKEMLFEADLVATPSRIEGFGLVSLESISAGVPVLVTSESGIAKALENVEGGTAVVVESEDPEEWAQKIKMLSQKNSEERHNMVTYLRKSYHKAYSWSEQCERFEKLIIDLMQAGYDDLFVDLKNIFQQKTLQPSLIQLKHCSKIIEMNNNY